MKKIWLTTITALFMALSTGCKSSENRSKNNEASITSISMRFAPGPKAIVYKTVKNYAKFVPVTLDETRTRIISYPAPTDIYYEGKLAVPTQLNNGYWLDNRGIGPNAAFTDYTYEEYSKLKEAPSLEILEKRIIDRNPITEYWNCGLRASYTDEVSQLNEVIKSGFKGAKNGLKK